MTRAHLLLVLFVAVLGAAAPASAYYRFDVPQMRMTNTIQPDASVVIEYEIRFSNAPFAQPIDIVDIGLPHGDYDFGTMEASIDSIELRDIRTSEYIDTGVEVHLGSHAIGPGESGTFRFRTVVPDMVFSDTTNDELASFQITPTWFDPTLVTGATDMQIAVRLPPGVPPERVLFQNEPFTHEASLDDTTLVGWRFASTSATGPHEVGVSFPRSSMERVVVITKLELLMRWFEGSPGARILLGLITAVVFGIFFFRFSGGTGISFFVFLLLLFGAIYGFAPRLQLWTFPLWLVAGGLMEWRLRKKKRDYLPPLVHVEGGGIKRGLTAPEAAVLLELPLGKVLTLVVFGLLKKGLVRQTNADPLRVDVAPAFRGKDRGKRRKAAAELGTVIHAYEHDFLDALQASHPLDVTLVDFSDAMRTLVSRVADRVMGFDVGETKEYYRRIVARAFGEAESIGEIEQRTRAVDKNLEWLLIDDRFPEAFETWGRSGYRYHPIWIRSHAPVPVPMPVGGAPAPAGGGGHAAPSFGDVAASFAGWTENVTGQLASVISPSSLAAPTEHGGVINLSGADKVTGDVLAAFFSGSGGGGGGGGGGGCACACAGCACACACAGGGR